MLFNAFKGNFVLDYVSSLSPIYIVFIANLFNKVSMKKKWNAELYRKHCELWNYISIYPEDQDLTNPCNSAHLSWKETTKKVVKSLT